MTVLVLQKALAGPELCPGPLDGIAGPKTRAAVRAFQAAQALGVDGIAGPKTLAKLTGKPKAGSIGEVGKAAEFGDISADMPWLAEAKRLIGTSETAGAGSNPAIPDMADAPGIAFGSEDVAWCGLFVAHCIALTLPDEAMPKNPLGARNWRKFGQEVAPQFGSVLVFWRVSPEAWQGHVGFCWAEDDTHYHVLGGNQSNAVNIMKKPKSMLLGARWPESTPPKGLRRFANGGKVQLSTVED